MRIVKMRNMRRNPQPQTARWLGEARCADQVTGRLTWPGFTRMAGTPIPRPPRPRWHSETLLRPQTRVNDGQSKTKCYSKAAKAKSRMSRTEERTHKRSVARIQRLCYLGLGGEAI